MDEGQIEVVNVVADDASNARAERPQQCSAVAQNRGLVAGQKKFARKNIRLYLAALVRVVSRYALPVG